MDVRASWDTFNQQASLLAMASNSKSGACFFFTKDMSYIVKTIDQAEADLMRKILKDFQSELGANQPMASQLHHLWINPSAAVS